MLCFFFFKQKTAYEMRISDWSSDVCSSDLAGDVLLSYNDTKIDSWQQWALWVRAHPDEVVKLRLRRGDQEQERTVILTHAEEGGKTIGRFGDRKSTRLNSSH